MLCIVYCKNLKLSLKSSLSGSAQLLCHTVSPRVKSRCLVLGRESESESKFFLLPELESGVWSPKLSDSAVGVSQNQGLGIRGFDYISHVFIHADSSSSSSSYIHSDE